MQPFVYFALPAYGPMEPETAISLLQATQRVKLYPQTRKISILTRCFNALWSDALNKRKEFGITHFAMQHADICPDAYWIDTLLDEMDTHGADIMAAVPPIKDGRGLTSTGWLDCTNSRVRRLTLTELHQMPETFSAASEGKTEEVLAFNTGLWVCRFTEPWVEQVHFQFRDAIIQGEDGTFREIGITEDWDFSAQVAKLGLKTMATRKVHISHYGRAEFTNDVPWGTQAQDAGD